MPKTRTQGMCLQCGAKRVRIPKLHGARKFFCSYHCGTDFALKVIDAADAYYDPDSNAYVARNSQVWCQELLDLDEGFERPEPPRDPKMEAAEVVGRKAAASGVLREALDSLLRDAK